MMINRTGLRYGSWTVLSYSHSNKKGTALWKCKCDCGFEAVRNFSSIEDNPNAKCRSCHIKILHKATGKTNGMYKNPTYRTWTSMINRCSKRFKNEAVNKAYFDKGIKVCERWMSYENFLADMGSRPDGLTIDRIDPDKGYEPSNCRWATWNTQAYNRPKPAGGTSKYRGVSYYKATGKWRTQIRKDDKPQYCGTFDTEVEAALEYNKWAVKLYGDAAKLNKIDEQELKEMDMKTVNKNNVDKYYQDMLNTPEVYGFKPLGVTTIEDTGQGEYIVKDLPYELALKVCKLIGKNKGYDGNLTRVANGFTYKLPAMDKLHTTLMKLRPLNLK